MRLTQKAGCSSSPLSTNSRAIDCQSHVTFELNYVSHIQRSLTITLPDCLVCPGVRLLVLLASIHSNPTHSECVIISDLLPAFQSYHILPALPLTAYLVLVSELLHAMFSYLEFRSARCHRCPLRQRNAALDRARRRPRCQSAVN